VALLLIDNAEVLVTMDGERREIGNWAILVRDHVIEGIGSSGEIRAGVAASGLEPERYIDAGGCVILPGLAAYRVDGVQHAGGDAVAALLTCAPVGAWLSLINGRIAVEQGRIVGLDLDAQGQQNNQQARLLLQRAASKGHYHD